MKKLTVPTSTSTFKSHHHLPNFCHALIFTTLSLVFATLSPYPVLAQNLNLNELSSLTGGQSPSPTPNTPSPTPTPTPASPLITSPAPTPTQLLNPSSINSTSQALIARPSRLGDDYSLTLLPSTQTTITVQLTNPTDQPLTVLTSAQDFIVGGDDGETPILVNSSPSNRWAMAEWITIAGSLNQLEPFETITIPVLISVPERVRSGGHYAMLVHQIIDGSSSDISAPLTADINNPPASVGLQTQSQITTQLGQMLYVIIPGDNLTEDLEIINFSFDTLRESGPINYSFAIKNTSDYHTHPVGEIIVTNFAGTTVATFPIDSNQNMFPDTTRLYEGTWDKSWGFGPYTATLNLVYGPNQTLLTAETVFWLLPVRFLILILLVIACSVVVSYNIHNKKIREEKEKSSHAKK